MKLASVGIVTRTKDRPLLVWRSMEGVLNQSYEDWRHILVDDGGNTDVLHGIIDKYGNCPGCVVNGGVKAGQRGGVKAGQWRVGGEIRLTANGG